MTLKFLGSRKASLQRSTAHWLSMPPTSPFALKTRKAPSIFSLMCLQHLAPDFFFHKLAVEGKSWPRGQKTTPREVAIRWCPGRAGILGNEAAEALAKAACVAPALHLALSTSRARREVKAQYEASVALYWAKNAQSRYKELGIGPNTKITIELARLGRRTIRYLLAARSGHDDFADYHRWF